MLSEGNPLAITTSGGVHRGPVRVRTLPVPADPPVWAIGLGRWDEDDEGSFFRGWEEGCRAKCSAQRPRPVQAPPQAIRATLRNGDWSVSARKVGTTVFTLIGGMSSDDSSFPDSAGKETSHPTYLPGWPRTHRDPPASACGVLGSKACTSTLSVYPLKQPCG